MNTNTVPNSTCAHCSLSQWLSSLLVLTTVLFANPGRVFALDIINYHAIEGYSDVLSVAPEETINFSIHMPAGHTRYTVEIYRFGLAYSGGNALGTRVAGPFTGVDGTVRNYTDTSHVDGLQWDPTFFLRVPSPTLAGIAPVTHAPIARTTWKSGIYTAKITDIDSPAPSYFHITFIVKDRAASRKSIALIASTNTWQAYNFWPEPYWGGSSIYVGAVPITGGTNVGAARDKVSFLRPNAYATPEVHDDRAADYLARPFYRTEHLTAGELRIAHWLEVNAKPYSMLTDWDISTIADVLDPAVFKTVIISTHSEYWSPEMYNAVKTYLDKGGNVISLSGNTCFWIVTLDSRGGNRTLEKGHPTFAARAGNPAYQYPKWEKSEQASLLGLASFLDSGTNEADCAPYTLQRRKHWSLSAVPALTSLGANGIVFNRTFALSGRGASGWEVDSTKDPYELLDPPNAIKLHVFAREYTDLAESSNVYQHSHMLYMRRASAGQVFSVGSILAGQSLMVDTNFSRQMLTVLNKFATPSFSDYTGNGTPDLIGLQSDGTLWAYDSARPGTLPTPRTQIASAWTGYNLLLSPGDMDGNGKSDLITRGVDGRLWLYKRHATTGALLPRLQIGTGWNQYDAILTPGDFDHDGRPDLIGRRPDGTLWLYKGTGTGSLATPIAIAGFLDWHVYTNLWSPGDLDEDGHPDLLARSGDGMLRFFQGDGNGSIVPPPVTGAPVVGTGWGTSLDILTPGDFNGDGHCDIIARKTDGTLSLYKSDWSSGSFNGFLTPTNSFNSNWQIYDQVVAVW